VENRIDHEAVILRRTTTSRYRYRVFIGSVTPLSRLLKKSHETLNTTS
jgi:hypothetical protein